LDRIGNKRLIVDFPERIWFEEGERPDIDAMISSCKFDIQTW
jgi:hypothetical protein